MEWLDVFSEKGTYTGIADREVVHQQGLWHQTFHCWVAQAPGFLLFQRRSPDKDVYPGKLDITAAGHLLAGEGPETGVRELEEELGLTVSFGELYSLGMRREVFAVNGFLNREFCHTYLLRCDQPLEDYVFPDGEVAGLVQVPLETGRAFFAGEAAHFEARVALPAGEAASRVVTEKIGWEDFIPRDPEYYLEMLAKTEEYLKGAKT